MVRSFEGNDRGCLGKIQRVMGSDGDKFKVDRMNPG
jgi:hypothetical protein